MTGRGTRALLLVLIAMTGIVGGLYLMGERPPTRWDPLAAFDPDAAPTLVTRLKLLRAEHDDAYCTAALSASRAAFTIEEDETGPGGCEQVGTVTIWRLSGARMEPLRTRCSVALRLYMLEAHEIQPMARGTLDAPVTRIEHYGSYSCRKMRTSRGGSRRLSQHATANAVDISGFRLADGRHITLERDWDHPRYGAFLRGVRDAACDLFRVVLGPDYNTLHADHFHLDLGNHSACR